MNVVAHGIDLVKVVRVRAMVDRHGDRFLDRVFTPGERDYACTRKRRDEHLAARFAAKEAVFKALGTGWRDGMAWTDIEVVPEASGRPSLRVRGEAARVAQSLGIAAWLISLSHTDDTAIASVIALGGQGSTGVR